MGRSFIMLISVILTLLGAALGLPTAAIADGGDPNLIHSCVNPSGLTRIVGSNDVCGSNETAAHWPKATGPSTVQVDCAMGQTISQALQSLSTPLTIVVKGICNENVVVARDAVTLQADPAVGGTVNGPDPFLATITVAGQDVVIDGLQVTGGRNGIEGVGAIRLTIQNCLVQNTGRNGIAFLSGTNGTVNHCTVQNNARDGVAVVFGASAVVINSMITGNVRRGVQIFQSANVLVGITVTNQLAGNTISNNGARGISVITGSSASIGGNTISGNGTNPNAQFGAGDRTGIFVFQAVADIAGGNTISGNAGSGVLVQDGRALFGDAGFGFTTINTIMGNGASVPPGFADGGVFVFRSGSVLINDANINGNTGNGVTALLRSTVQLNSGSVNNNTGNGILLSLGGTLLLNSGTVTGNGGFGLRCNDAESSAVGNFSGITGNTAGQVSPACTGF